jgi:hypothetical protein
VSSAVEGPPHLAFAVARSSQRNPKAVISTEAQRSGEIRFSISGLTRGSNTPSPPEHHAYKKNWR